MGFSDAHPVQQAHVEEGVANVVVYSRSELIGDGLIGLLPREWRQRTAIVPDVETLERLVESARTSVIIDADTPAAAEALRITRARGGSAIMLLGDNPAEFERESLEQADAILNRDETEALTLRIALAAGRLGMRLVPRSLSAADPASDAAIANLSETARRALMLLGEGMRDAEIAGQLHLSESAVRKLIQRTVRGVGARTRCQAIAMVMRDPNRTLERTT
jgi:DNA-binding NarL/FixJ family response regulator